MNNRRVESFVIRVVVRENGPLTADGWCGRIQHITTGDECQFNQINDVLAFMSSHMHEVAGDTSAMQQELLPLE